jgi:hypothetical protein
MNFDAILIGSGRNPAKIGPGSGPLSRLTKKRDALQSTDPDGGFDAR